ncbi:hypothetical protein E2C01_063047 [Portunus trituberculatus]|uniref:Uncharacterized protein n=1 Tax=Portunus trituberculatus TaxID=210409 RepID=A0A5B7HFU7_PORTR|nr:hypothetical protein [Portunus trituberculatus]
MAAKGFMGAGAEVAGAGVEGAGAGAWCSRGSDTCPCGLPCDAWHPAAHSSDSTGELSALNITPPPPPNMASEKILPVQLYGTSSLCFDKDDFMKVRGDSRGRGAAVGRAVLW